MSTPLGTHDAGPVSRRARRPPETPSPPDAGVASCVPSGAATIPHGQTATGYCGSPCRGLTCGNHRDLLALDPNTAKGVANLVKESTEGSRLSRTDGAPLRRR